MLRTLRIFFTSFPFRIIFWKIKCKILNLKIPKNENWQNFFKDKSGIEIGGPSTLFKTSGHLPLYPFIQSLDGVNFSTSTVWEGKLAEGNFYKYADKTGYQYIAEGSYLPKIKDETYDFVLSCNNMEHIANPIAALLEWKRIIKKGGVVLLVLPNKMANFDHQRPYTNIEHLVDDFKKNITEDDDTHLPEILRLHDLTRDPQAGNYEQFKERCKDNIINRCMHHHVFNETLLSQLIHFCDMELLLQFSSPTDHYTLALKKQ